MKKLLTVFAITAALAQAGYCADTAWDGLKQMGGEKELEKYF